MDNYLEKEFSIGDIMNLNILRNDFEALGSVIEMKLTQLIPTNHIIIMSFYNEENIQIHQKNLLLLCNSENVLFDNILILNNLRNKKKDDYKIKFLNKELSYMKLYIEAYNSNSKKKDNYNFTQIFNLKYLKILSLEEKNELILNNQNLNFQNNNIINNRSDNNNNLNLILSELDNINQSLVLEKSKIDKEKIDMKNKEIFLNNQKEQINKMIITFKEEIMLFGDKCYGECVNEVNEKILQLNKKINNVENNVMNKYRIIKDKFNNNLSINSNLNNNLNTGNKDKLANLEIKIKFLEDSILTLKNKINEKEEKIKNYSSNEEKNNKLIKKLKDDIVLLNSQLKEKKEKIPIKNTNDSISIIQKIPNKIKKNLISFEIGKIQIEHFNKIFVKNILLKKENSSEKEKQVLSLLLMHLSSNPIELYNKYKYGHIVILSKLIQIYKNKSLLNNLSNYISDYFEKFNEYKSNINIFLNNNKNIIIDIEPIILLNINKNKNLSQIISNKCNSFDSFIMKSINNKKLNEKHDSLMDKFISISNSLLCILFSRNFQEIIDQIKNISDRYIYTRSISCINYLVKNKYIHFFLNIIIKNQNENLIEIFIDTCLIILSISEEDSKKNRINFLKEFDIINNIFETNKILELIKKNINSYINFSNDNSYNKTFTSESEIEKLTTSFMKSLIFLSSFSNINNNIQNIIKNTFSKEITELNKISMKNKNSLLGKNLNILNDIITNEKIK